MFHVEPGKSYVSRECDQDSPDLVPRTSQRGGAPQCRWRSDVVVARRKAWPQVRTPTARSLREVPAPDRSTAHILRLSVASPGEAGPWFVVGNPRPSRPALMTRVRPGCGWTPRGDIMPPKRHPAPGHRTPAPFAHQRTSPSWPSAVPLRPTGEAARASLERSPLAEQHLPLRGGAARRAESGVGPAARACLGA